MLHQVESLGETIIILREGTAYLVRSHSEPDAWHECSRLTCDCKGYQYRGHCRHIAAVRAYLLRVVSEEVGHHWRQRAEDESYWAQLDEAKANAVVYEEVGRHWRQRRPRAQV